MFCMTCCGSFFYYHNIQCDRLYWPNKYRRLADRLSLCTVILPNTKKWERSLLRRPAVKVIVKTALQYLLEGAKNIASHKKKNSMNQSTIRNKQFYSS